jgi:antirestriction protein ArdC
LPSVFDIISSRIIIALEEGEIPWIRPWVTVDGSARSRITGKPYSLLNQMLLSHGSGEYATSRQWAALGGSIKKEEKPEIIVFWKWPDQKRDEQENEDQEKKRERPVLKYYRVYHISQIEGVAPSDQRIRLYNHNPIEQAETLLRGYVKREGIKLETGLSNEAYYSPGRDVIHIPDMMQFEYVEGYYSTYLHEAIHSTGHSRRLNRKGLQNVEFGSEKYSFEELVAEIGSLALTSQLGILTDRSSLNSTGYCQNWAKVLRNDKKMIVFAASQAEKAVRFINM